MSKIKDGGAAFPLVKRWTGDGYPYDCAEGMSLRDWFAGQALPAVIAATSAGQHQPQTREGEQSIILAIARDAYEMADAMLIARQSQGGDDA